MKLINLILALLISISYTYCQNFEGKIVYQNEYKSKSFFISDAKLADMMGNTQESYYKNDKYLNKLNGNMIEWQLYLPNENKLYSKSGLSESIYWNNAAENKDEIKSIKVNRKAARVLGNMCDEVVIETKSGTTKYYFSEGVAPLNSTIYEKHLFGNWYEYLKLSNSLPLKYIIDTPQFTLTATAEEIKSEKLSDKIFELPANAKIEKAPF